MYIGASCFQRVAASLAGFGRHIEIHFVSKHIIMCIWQLYFYVALQTMIRFKFVDIKREKAFGP